MIGASVLARAPVAGAVWMVAAGVTFAAVNILVQVTATSSGLSSASVAFWQYLFALVAMLPVMVRRGLPALRTGHLGWQIGRAALAAAGVQLWVAGLAWPVPIWAAIALVMTSPFFVTLGAGILLRERVTPIRWAAVAVGFLGGLVILDPWSDMFTWAALLPVGAAALWAGSSLTMKRLLADETPETTTVWLLLLLAPLNLALAGWTGFALPGGDAVLWLILAGVLTAIAQAFLAFAYAGADAAYVQPFDHLKLPLNVLAGFLVFGWVPPGHLWLGAAMIIGASLVLMVKESGESRS